MWAQSLGEVPTSSELVELGRRRESLLKRINDLIQLAGTLFPNLQLEPIVCQIPDLPEPCFCEGACACQMKGENAFDAKSEDPENMMLLLPSSAPSGFEGLSHLKETERRLRVGQADEVLEAIRTNIGHKSYLFRARVRLATSTADKTRGYSSVKAVNRVLKKNSKIYAFCRWSLSRLGASKDLEKFKVLRSGDTAALTSIYDPNASAQRDASLSWIWKTVIHTAEEKDDYIRERMANSWAQTGLSL